MRFLIYKITNIINGRYYIGRHSTTDINDGYMGSGRGIKNAITKYGISNFRKEILAEAHDSESLWTLEREIVNIDVVKDPLSYNVAYGGKHYLDGLKKYDYPQFIEHQRSAGKKGGKAAMALHDSAWHAKGGASSSRKNASRYKYRLTLPSGEIYELDGNTLKALCLQKGWNYDTLIWVRHKNRPVASGQLAGFRLDQIESPRLLRMRGST